MLCAVWNCANERRNNEAKKSFFIFPKDEKLREEWLQFCGRTAGFKPKTWRVCMDHFNKEDVVGDLAYKMGFREKRYLKSGAVPCIYVHASPRVRKNSKRLQKNKFIALVRSTSKEISTITRRETNFYRPITTNEGVTPVTQRVANDSLPVITSVTSVAGETNAECGPLAQVKLLRNQIQKVREEDIAVEQRLRHSELNHQHEINAEMQKNLTKVEVDTKNMENQLLGLFPEEYFKIEINEGYLEDYQWVFKIKQENNQCTIKTEQDGNQCDIKIEQDLCEFKIEQD